MSLGINVVSGPFTATYATTDMGKTKDGFRLQRTVSKQLITSDYYGDSVIDGVYRGGNCFLGLTGIDYALIKPVVWPYGGASGFNKMGQVGRQDVASTIVGATVLTAVASTPAASSPASLTATNSIIAEDYDFEALLGTGVREIPLRLRLYPYDLGSGVIGWFSET